MPNILILGGGFAGYTCARELSKLLPEHDSAEITLVDVDNFLLFTPLITEVAGGELDERDAIAALRALTPRVNFIQGQVEHIDAANRTVQVCVGVSDPELQPARQTIHADHIVVALGSVTSYHHVSGAEEYSIGIKTVEEAADIRNRAMLLLNRASVEPDESERRALLTFVVGGGGFSGVETMASLNDFVRSIAHQNPALREEEIRCVLVHPGSYLLPELDRPLGDYAQGELSKRGVEVVLNTEISSLEKDCAHLSSGTNISTHVVVWAAGITPNPVVAEMGVPLGKHHGIVVDGCGRVSGFPGIWAIGDCAEMPKPDGGTYAPIAQNAQRQGPQIARNIAAVMQGREPQPFRYHPMGQLALVGRRAGVARLFGVNLSGWIAWAMWRGMYLSKMPTMRKRVRVGIDWLLDLIFGRDLAQLPARGAKGSASAEAGKSTRVTH